ncbi:MAG: hypothetical protein OZX49_01983 [Immundisolibacter sp.]|nr:hypothetical protein [Immundisolibacter sp.]
MHGDDLHQVGVAFQAQLLVLGHAVDTGDGIAQEAQLRIQAGPAGGLRLQQFAQVNQVGQRPRAVGTRMQAADDAGLLHQPQQHGQRTCREPAPAGVVEQDDPAFPGRLVAVERGDVGGRGAQQVRGKSSPQRAAGGRIERRLQNPLQRHRLGALVNAVFSKADAVDAGPAQLRLHLTRLPVGLDQDADVATGELVCTYPRLTRRAQREQLRHPRGSGGQRLPVCAVLAQRLARFATRQPPHLKGRQRLAVHQQWRLLAPASGVDRVELDLLPGRVEHKRPRVASKQRIHGPHQPAGGALVGGQRVALGRRHAIANGQIREHVRAAKLVNGLLGVADQVQAETVRGGPVHAVKQAVLERVGVLELVDHHHRVARCQGARQRRPAGTIQRRGQLLQQAVETAPAAGQQARLALRTQVRQRRVHGLHMQRVRERRAGHRQGGGGIQQRVRRRSDAFLAGTGGQRLIEHGRAEALDARGWQALRLRGPGVDGVKQRGQLIFRIALFLVAAESLVPQQQSQRVIPPSRPDGDEVLHGRIQRRLPRRWIDLRRRRQ